MEQFTLSFIVAICAYSWYRYKVRRKRNESTHKAEAVVQQLCDIGYFSYAAPDDILALHANLVLSLTRGYLSTVYTDESWIPKDCRIFMFDTENLSEIGGFAAMIKQMESPFNKMGLKMVVTNFRDRGTNEGGANDELTINGKRYIALSGSNRQRNNNATAKFAAIINDQMMLQQKDERLYLIGRDKDGYTIFLTKAQFDVVDKLQLDGSERPTRVGLWSDLENPPSPNI